MKKTLMTLLTLLLVAVLALTLFACGKEEEKGSAEIKGPKTDVGAYKSEGYEASTLKNQVSWEGINSFKSTKDIATLYTTDQATAIAEARQISVDFFRYAKTATWIPADNWDFTHHDNGDGPDSMTAGITYGGLPYVGLASSAIYRLMDFIDPETGVVDILSAGGEEHVRQRMFGNQCANGAYQGWSRFINSAKYSGTPKMTVANGFLRVGDYKYPDYTNTWTEGYNTKAVCTENGDQAMFQSYAKLIAGDGIVNFTTAGHVIMIASDAHVEYADEAKTIIDGTKSYCITIDQHVQFSNYQHPDGGDQCQAANYIDRKMTFQSLLSGGYLPFTYKEWTGEDPIEMPETTTSHSGDTIKVDDFTSVKVSSNYHIYDAYISVYNANGVEVYKLAAHNDGASEYELRIMTSGLNCFIWGSEENIYADQEYTVKIYAQLGTGERPVLWEGKLAH